jgi:hypothetical protein
MGHGNDCHSTTTKGSTTSTSHCPSRGISEYSIKYAVISYLKSKSFQDFTPPEELEDVTPDLDPSQNGDPAAQSTLDDFFSTAEEIEEHIPSLDSEEEEADFHAATFALLSDEDTDEEDSASEDNA